MKGFHDFFDHWGALFTAVMLLALPLFGWFYRGSWSWMETVVGGVGIGALLLAVEELLRRREFRRACPHCGEPLLEGA